MPRTSRRQVITALVGSHRRKAELAVCLRHLQYQQGIPSDWRYRIVVAGMADDLAGKLMTERTPRATWVPVESETPGAKFQAALERAQDSQIVMVSGDDDLSSLRRAHVAILAWQAGNHLSGCSYFRFVDVDTWDVMGWMGPAELCGAALNWDVELLRTAGGWDTSRPFGIDGDLRERVMALGRKIDLADVAEHIGGEMVMLQHGRNLNNRPVLGFGDVAGVVNYTVAGEGKADTMGDFPQAHMESLRILRGLRQGPKAVAPGP